MYYKVISITRWGETINLDNLDIVYAGKDYCLAKPKGYGNCFMTNYSSANCYTVVTEQVEA